jgi:hypothetical protein
VLRVERHMQSSRQPLDFRPALPYFLGQHDAVGDELSGDIRVWLSVDEFSGVRLRLFGRVTHLLPLSLIQVAASEVARRFQGGHAQWHDWPAAQGSAPSVEFGRTLRPADPELQVGTFSADLRLAGGPHVVQPSKSLSRIQKNQCGARSAEC